MPSRKILSLLVLTTGLVLAIIIAFGREKSKVAINTLGSIAVKEKISIPRNPDWQDELETIGVYEGKAELEQDFDLGPLASETQTETVSKTLISNYLSLKQSGVLDKASAQKLIDQTDAFINQPSGSFFRVSQLSLIADGDKQAMALYGEKVGSALRDNKKSGFANELKIFQEAITNRDVQKIQELSAIADSYERISFNLLAIEVPVSFREAHLDMANAMRGISFALRDMAEVFNDPIRGLGGMRKYQDNAILFGRARQATAEYILSNSITYKQGSGGYYLIYGI